VWLDNWVIEPGESIPLKIHQGLESSHTVLVCMSPAYFGSDWGWAEHLTQLFEDPTNKQRRLIPLLIEDCTRPKIIAHLSYIDWREPSDAAYDKIFASCHEKSSALPSASINSGIQLNNPKTFISSSTDMEFVLIPAGKSMMGSRTDEQDRDNDEGPIHEVIIKNSFYVGKFPVTQKQWGKVMGSDPSSFKGKNHPVESVSWNDVQEFIKKLNEKDGTGKYRLPSESEWEYACRAGTATRYYFGDDESKLVDYAWYGKNSDFVTHPVGKKNPNPWGLYDMHGNVWEWCQDNWHENYNGAPTDGSAWEDGSSSDRVIRGGGWLNSARVCWSAYRVRTEPDKRNFDQGFRLLRNS
jgi:formylglycine-generating enzyme required for sulfatase activity